MEMWWIGVFADLWKLLVFLGLTFAVSLPLIYFAGFKDEGRSFRDVLDQAIDAMSAWICSTYPSVARPIIRQGGSGANVLIHAGRSRAPRGEYHAHTHYRCCSPAARRYHGV
jgi:hypothetical protein